MSADLLAPATRMGAVTLRVADLDAMTAYYRDAVTLTVLEASGEEVVLGRGAERVLVLVRSPELRHAPARSAGLFHTAILFDSEADLAVAVHAVATRHPGSFTGSADHLVRRSTSPTPRATVWSSTPTATGRPGAGRTGRSRWPR
jgi:catechol 2,3-dioxygenase